MKIQSLFFLILIGLVLSSCNTKEKEVLKESKITYQTASNYFVKNNCSGSVENPITSQEAFDKIFGMATTMGKDGKPTSIDFSKSYVVAIVDSLTDKRIDLLPVSVEKKNDTLEVKYSKNIGEVRSYSTQPNLIFILDNTTQGIIKVVQAP